MDLESSREPLAACLLLMGAAFFPELSRMASGLSDVELVDLERLHHGS